MYYRISCVRYNVSLVCKRSVQATTCAIKRKLNITVLFLPGNQKKVCTFLTQHKQNTMPSRFADQDDDTQQQLLHRMKQKLLLKDFNTKVYVALKLNPLLLCLLVHRMKYVPCQMECLKF